MSSEVRRPLRMELPETVYRLSRAFRSAGYELYVVGGAVRDAVMGRPAKDIDLATNATPDQVIDVLSTMLPVPTADLTGHAFGVVRAQLREMMEEVRTLTEYEIATFREDISMGRHPQVRFATIKEDVQRRDLTINALFYDIEKEEVVDLVGGLDDIQNRVIRMVGNPRDRFAEDRLRVMRAIRFATRFDFDIDPGTSRAIFDDNSLYGVSPERIRDELVRAIDTAQRPWYLMSLMDAFNMWSQVLPGFQVCTYVSRPPRPHDRVSTHRLTTNNYIVAFALFLDDEDPETLEKKLNRLKYASDEAAAITFLLRLQRLTRESAPKLRKAFQTSKLREQDLIEYVEARGLPVPTMFEAFLRYLKSEPFKGEPLMAQGFIGKALGQELQRLETEKFQSLVGA